MSRLYSHLNTAKTILSIYKGETPFSAFIKKFFAEEKKYGSRDRRSITSLCYNYFRLGFAVPHERIDERLLMSIFLCGNQPNEKLQKEKPEWNQKITSPFDEKLLISGIDVETIFPLNDNLSEGIDIKSFNTSFLIQPKLFARVRPGKLHVVKQKLALAQVNFVQVNESCLAFENGTKLEEAVDINREVVIQDFNSQRVGEFLIAANLSANSVSVWDCCAASGGKSIMACDILLQIRLTVSDVRPSILKNLHKRFADAGLKNYASFVADLTNIKSVRQALRDTKFDLVICDAPCSGSGTWSRTPEQSIFFQKEEITHYSNLQKSICRNSLTYVVKGGYFLYVTCSVFKRENEDIVQFIMEDSTLTLLKMELLKGYDIEADTMFTALFRRY